MASPRCCCYTRSIFTRSLLQRHVPHYLHRSFTVLAIETSCDDTSVAILYSPSSTPEAATLLAHKTITSPNRIYGGIHPLISVAFHRAHLGALVSSVLPSLPSQQRRPDIVAVTRGPGMLASLAVGMDTAKGLALAWGVPLVGVNHMQAHALTPRLLSALGNGDGSGGGGGALAPQFPFMTLLVSGGHTMVVKSAGLTDHRVLAKTVDIALGDLVDKCARTILPPEVLEAKGEAVAYGAVLEEYCFGARAGERDVYEYQVEDSPERKLEDKIHLEKWGDWKLSKPLTKTGEAKRLMQLTFCGLGSTLDRYVESKTASGEAISEQERKELGRKLMMLAFEHTASRVVMGLNNLDDSERREIKTLVVSGGVAANRFLKHMLKRYLEERGYPDIQLVVPPQEYCTDNAAMIAWAGLEMFRAGWETDIMALPVRKWSLDNSVYVGGEEDVANENGTGGVLGAAHWRRRGI